jgi:hypothetical protein
MDWLAWGIVAAWLAQAALATFGCWWTLHLLARPQPWPERWSPLLVLVPVRGERGLAAFLDGLAAQDHPDWRVAFATESVEDPAHPVLARFVAADPARRSLVVAGPVVRRGQKVQNLLAALGTLQPTDAVIATLDADAVPPPDMLRALLRPLETNQGAISTGYRWSLPAPGAGLPGALLSMAEIAVATLPRCARCNLCWGGATAIRCDALDLEAVWDRALSDDLVLTRAAWAADRLIYAPLTVRPVTPVGSPVLAFGARQYRLLRLHVPRAWAYAGASLGLACLGALATLGLALGGAVPALVALLASFGLQAARAGLRAGIARRVLPPAEAAASARLLRVAPLLAPAVTALHAACWLGSLLGRDIAWAGRRYTLDSEGRVTAIRHVS